MSAGAGLRRTHGSVAGRRSWRLGVLGSALLLATTLVPFVPGAAAPAPLALDEEACEWVGTWTRSESFKDTDVESSLESTSTSVEGASGCQMDLDYVWDQKGCENRHHEYHGPGTYRSLSPRASELLQLFGWNRPLYPERPLLWRDRDAAGGGARSLSLSVVPGVPTEPGHRAGNRALMHGGVDRVADADHDYPGPSCRL